MKLNLASIVFVWIITFAITYGLLSLGNYVGTYKLAIENTELKAQNAALVARLEDLHNQPPSDEACASWLFQMNLLQTKRRICGK